MKYSFSLGCPHIAGHRATSLFIVINQRTIKRMYVVILISATRWRHKTAI